MKSWIYSRTIWGGLVAIIASVLAGSGIEIGPEDQAQITDRILDLIAAVGGVIAIYGRFKAGGIK